jgi:KUP system potassium uptake protein
MKPQSRRTPDSADEPPPAGAQASSDAPPPGAPPLSAAGTSGFHAAVPQRQHVEAHPTGKRLAILSFTALGVVYGDIGTSPLYAMRQAFSKEYGLAAIEANVYGVLSMIVWSLVIVVAIKYIYFIMSADNRGEGGVMALLALVLQQERRTEDRRRRKLLISVGLFGAALLYGDGIITPAISVLGATEGLDVVSPQLARWAAPMSFIILVGVFAVQRFGTAKVGVAFGPIMLLWFLFIAALGAHEILLEPRILAALNPWYAVEFFQLHGRAGAIVLGAVVLVITGAEALYADMGHFGRRPIRVAWFTFVMPALLLNYFGQGALILREPAAAENPFFRLAPDVLLWPLLAVATLAAIVASQALISGAFSLTQQSVQLGYSPRMTVVHTSKQESGQIYIPEINQALMIGTLLLVVLFQSSTKLGAAYGIAVTGTMGITTILFHVVAHTQWKWKTWKITLLTGTLLSIDAAFLTSNLVKIPHGGWIPIAIALAVFTLMSTWKKGRKLLNQVMQAGSLPLDLFLDDVARRKPPRVPGTAVFMTSSAEGVPVVLLHHLKHNKVLHEQVILMSVRTKEVPEIPVRERLTVQKLEHGFYRIESKYGFMEQPNVPEILQLAREHGVRTKPNDTTFYLGRERIIVSDGAERPGTRRAPAELEVQKLAKWRKKLFVVMSRNARSATEFFEIPPNRVVELGAQVEF